MQGTWPCARRMVTDQCSCHGTERQWGYARVITYPVAGCWPHWPIMYSRSGIAIVTIYVQLRESHAEGEHMRQA